MDMLLQDHSCQNGMSKAQVDVDSLTAEGLDQDFESELSWKKGENGRS
jgi:hypothetical protein